MTVSVVDLPVLADGLSSPIRQACARIYDIVSSRGGLTIPEALAPKVAKWYARDGDRSPDDAFARATGQVIVSVLNRYSFESTVFNALRAQRPLGGSQNDELERQIEAARKDCDFCDPLRMTTADEWGRIESTRCVTAANAAKYDAVHGLIIFREHHPLRFGEADLEDVWDAALAWLERSHRHYPSATHPFLMWNCLFKAGASQIHGHAQALLSQGRYYGQGELHRNAAARYRAETGRDYFDDLIAVHEALGLIRRRGDSATLAHLTPKKEKEVLIVGPAFSADFRKSFYHALRTLIDRLGTQAFNVGMYLPPMGSAAGARDPIVARIVDRGDPSRPTVDFGAMEMYGSSVVASDPFRVIEALNPG